MKKIGMIGGLSWESSLEYYRLINQGIKARLGEGSSAKMLIESVNFKEIHDLESAKGWPAVGDKLARSAQRLERAGADFIIIACNTVHFVADQVERAVSVPFIHIADAAANEIKAAGLDTIGLMGTRMTVSQGFYGRRLKDGHGVRPLVSDPEDIELVQAVIHDELVNGVFTESSALALKGVAERLVSVGAQGVVLACTELALSLKPEMVDFPVFDTTAVHARAAVEAALS